MMTNTKLPYLVMLMLAFVLVSCDQKKKEAVSDIEKASTEAAETTIEELAAAAGSFGAFEFKEKSHDFGTLQQGDTVMHTFSFTNKGTVPLVISKARGSCGCTVPEYPTEPIAVGASGDILVKFNSKGKSGSQNKTVTLTANTDPQNTILTITSFVETPDKK